MQKEEELSEFEKKAPQRARHRALIAKILKAEENDGNHDGLTVQQIIEKELKYFKYSFLTDNRLREMRRDGWVESIDEIGKPQRWRLKKSEG